MGNPLKSTRKAKARHIDWRILIRVESFRKFGGSPASHLAAENGCAFFARLREFSKTSAPNPRLVS